MRNIRITLAYDGARYVGWQVQPNGPSVQTAVEKAISKLAGEPIQVLAAGRTDSGVHALGQMISFRTTSHIPGHKFAPALQQFLPDDIIARESAEVPMDFHATFSAVRKRYRYVIHNVGYGLPFLNRYAYRYYQVLDTTAMQAAAERLVGTFDFRCFETQYPNKATSVRTIMECTVRRTSGWSMWHSEGPVPGDSKSGNSQAGSDDYIFLDIVADGFLYNMVRTIAGTLVRVGRGFWNADDVTRIIEGLDRNLAGDTAPAHALYLVKVDYPSEVFDPVATV